MHFHLIVTDECNLCCSYCRGKIFEAMDGADNPEGVPIETDPFLPPELDFDLPLLYNFLKKDPSSTLTFYGGEPLMRPDIVSTIVQEAPVQRFMLQTNGLLLDQLCPEIINRFSTILISVDGREDLTDVNRGKGTYRKVMHNIKKIRNDGYTRDLIARMTVNENTDIDDAVHWLAGNPDYSFSSIHWQLDANFTSDFPHRRFRDWVVENYNPGILRLVTDWVDHMENEREVLRWYPFLDPMEDLLLGRQSMLRCGSGHANYSIMTDGHIAPCPVMIGMSQYYVGHIRDSDPRDLAVITINGECADCHIRGFCGGRCLYSNIIKPWGADERRIVCSTVETLHTGLLNALPRVKDLIARGVILPADFSHEKYNGCEIIP
ncbi:MAG: TIGR04084 family radical SAM/SPASM domain-containing protein [Methanoregula sp.]|nr:TIGR04084 family radical SAM/SPASM domain-containing protein [Methanoregula sp.]